MKAGILAAGYGTRFLPVTRVVPKELLPILSRPALALVVDELKAAGVTDLLVIGSRRKRGIEDWFDVDPELQAVFSSEGREDKLALTQPPAGLRVTTVRQTRMGGTGHALLLAREFAGRDPVLVAYPDDLFGPPNPCAALIAHHQRTGRSVLAAADLGEADVSAYGVLDVSSSAGEQMLNRIVEKPAPGSEPSKLVSYGRYLYTPDFFDALAEGYQRHQAGEYFHVPALLELAARGRVGVEVIDSPRFDTGTPLAWLEANLALGLRDPEQGPAIRDMMKRLLVD